ncbi:DUF5134 domain-containing protein [Streptomyces thermoviolaceus]|uniref:DUF5134 domain-containing protein n=1 Tax=Streptomyces thermoviolaceus TaxID=1952 RepID=UPI00167ACBBF|nr:DUF5134 domain-containing protein [Streptomyces thermoviolaceus]WTD50283.1 DUF5134 domain-containing protein [Streptomyces thermoviolaceus]GGV64065.1 DUF5134 domain-containing protein [Streptomyces thermoviolaceus subsp. apingens]
MQATAALSWLLVALCTATGTYCLLRMRSQIAEQRRTAGGEALMGFGMAAMAVPAAVFTPPDWVWWVCAAVFGAAALPDLWRARKCPHHLHHLVGAGSMVYMSLSMAGSPGPHHHHAHGGSGTPVVTGVLLLYFAGYVLLSGVRLIPAARPAGAGSTADTGVTDSGGPGWGDRPELARACRLSMGMAMVAMLLTM